MMNFNPAGVMIIGIMILALLCLFWRPRFKWLLRSSKKQMVIRYQSQWLSRKLLARYGLREHYTPSQVKRTIRESGYSTDYDCYGLAMYCHESDFIDFHQSIGESCDYQEMRHEISNCLSLPNTTFNASDLIHIGISPSNTCNGEHQGNGDYGNSHDSGNGTNGDYYASCDSSSGYDSGGGYGAGGGGE
jgi:hypothetical protein